MRMSIEPAGPTHGTLGCAEFDQQAIEAAAEIWRSGEPGTRVLHHDDGDIEVFLEPHRAPPRVIAVSATDVARAVCRQLGAARLRGGHRRAARRAGRRRRRRRGVLARRGGPVRARRRRPDRSRRALREPDAGGRRALAGAVRGDDELTTPRGGPSRCDPRDGRAGRRHRPGAHPGRPRSRASATPTASRCRSPRGSWPTRTIAPAAGWTDEPRRRPSQSRELGGGQRRLPAAQRRPAEPMGSPRAGASGICRRTRWARWATCDGLDALELGCGAAQFGIRVAMRGARVVGLDFSANQLAAAGPHLRETGVRMPLVRGDAEELPFADERFDLVFCDHGATTFTDPRRHRAGGRPGASPRRCASSSTSRRRSSG